MMPLHSRANLVLGPEILWQRPWQRLAQNANDETGPDKKVPLGVF